MIKKIALVVVTFLSFVFNVNGYSYDYYIERYDVKIVVNEDNSYDITEEISTFFNEPKHGIYRKIPIKNRIVRSNGRNSHNHATISNVSVNNKYVVYKDANYYEIKIGDAEKYVTGSVDYKISYNYNIGKDDTSKFDEFYFNIIGDEWDTYIDAVYFEIVMPKDFNKEKIGFSLGTKGTIGYDEKDIIYTVDGNIIRGTALRRLNSNEALTIRIELEDGYFSKAEEFVYWYDVVYIVAKCLMIIAVAYAIYCYYIKKKENKEVIPVEFYPPKNCNSLEAGYIYNGEVNDKMIMSLLVYLASKGYIQINEKSYDGIFKTKNGYTFKKLKEYDGNNKIEKTFMNGMFDKSDEITDLDLHGYFYKTVTKISKEMNSKEIKNQIFEKKYKKHSTIINLLTLLILILLSIVPNYFTFGGDSPYVTIIFPVIGQFIIATTLFGIKDKTGKIGLISFFSIWSGVPWLFLILPGLIGRRKIWITYVIGMIVILFIQYIKSKSKVRTQYSNDLYCKLKGFRNFIEIAEKEKLEALIKENPTYFYDIIPYAYVFGLTNKWISNFEGIAVPPASWYNGSSTSFNNFIIKDYSRVMTVINHNPSSSSGSSGGSSGGSSSGGGSGGGGGGSW